jgi:hypothetical protein
MIVFYDTNDSVLPIAFGETPTDRRVHFLHLKTAFLPFHEDWPVAWILCHTPAFYPE